MENCGSGTRTQRRIVLFPLPFQGHINPMLQLANILHTHGFKITVIHAEYNSPNHSNYPHFTFKSIKDNFSEIADELDTNPDASYFLNYLNRSCVDSFKECLSRLLDKEAFACLITDVGFYFTQTVADELNLPRVALRTSSLAHVLAYGALPFHSNKDCFYLTKEDSDFEAQVPEYPLMKFKDIVKITTNPQGMGDFVTNMLNHMKALKGIIWNTFKELEESSLETISQDYPVPSFTLGPFHKYFPASSSIQPDQTILSWLDNQAPKSTIYVSFGSVAHISELEFREVAYALANIGCFCTHNGWNSTLESICEGVPMICSPCFVDQPINARYVSEVWKIAIFLENGFERVGIESAIKRIMMDKEGEEMRERICYLKEKVSHSLIGKAI
ncbi:putative UDP-glucuronosyl/UDP-glucosyltransferase, partial [Tanacetum coccineum]